MTYGEWKAKKAAGGGAAKDGVLQAVKEYAAGLRSHSDREGFGLECASAAAGEDVQLVSCDKGTLTAWSEGKGEEREFANLTSAYFRGELDPAGQVRLKNMLDAKERARLERRGGAA